eukprot:3481552-Prymnesium_polylepis.1
MYVVMHPYKRQRVKKDSTSPELLGRHFNTKWADSMSIEAPNYKLMFSDFVEGAVSKLGDSVFLYKGKNTPLALKCSSTRSSIAVAVVERIFKSLGCSVMGPDGSIP